MAEKDAIKLTVNGKTHEFTVGDGLEPRWPRSRDVYPWDVLAETLRGKLGLKGTKVSCDGGACGACAVLMNGKLILSCMKLTVDCDGAEITTIEGLSDAATGALHPVQQAFIENNGTQCGFCAPGMVLASKALLDGNPDPTKEDVKRALAGNICRCGNYNLITKSVLAAAEKINNNRKKGAER
jgi:carbon-monoxide dehydrogenase small subunit